MATGGIFTIITNDGKQDRMLMATDFLHQRLYDINQANLAKNGGAPDDIMNLPTLLDIERTHVLFTNAHFKPFAAMGFEYNKVKPTGPVTLGQDLQFSIPQFGDFFHDVCAHITLTQPTLTSTATANSNAPAMRWCNFPGERLLKRVMQEVNGNPLDEYNLYVNNIQREFRVSTDKLRGYYQAIGQELPANGYIRQPDWVGSGVAAPTSRIGAQVYTGNQTPTSQKVGSLELFVPLLFWYNRDVRLAVPSVAIPYGQRYINFTLATQDELVGLYPRGTGSYSVPNGSLSSVTVTMELYINNIFVNPEVHKIYIKRVGFSLIRVHRIQLYTATSNTYELLLNQLKWPIEFLVVGMKVKNYVLGADSATKWQYLDKWDKWSTVTDTTYLTTGQNVMRESTYISDLTTTVGVAVTTGVGTGTGILAVALAAGDMVRIGGSFFTVIVGALALAAITTVTFAPSPAVAITAAAASLTWTAKVLYQGLEVTAPVAVSNIDSIIIKAHGIPIYNDFPRAFFNDYLPLQYGGPNIRTPDDDGLLFVPFCLYPGTYQPSGHINVSRAREFYLTYVSSTIDGTTNGLLVIIASAINFLLISDGSAVLRYST